MEYVRVLMVVTMTSIGEEYVISSNGELVGFRQGTLR